jgi:flagellar motor switch protein FliN/FliY
MKGYAAMPEATEAKTKKKEHETKPASSETDAKIEVHPADLPEAPQDAAAETTGQLDILLDMDVPIRVVLGAAEIPVRRLLQLGPGAVLKLAKPIDAPADLYLKDSKFAEADVVVVENEFAVRIKRIVGAAVTDQPAQNQTA